MDWMRVERLQREMEEHRRAQALLDQKNGKGKDEASRKETEETDERERPYNSAFFPELAQKRQRRDRDSWREAIPPSRPVTEKRERATEEEREKRDRRLKDSLDSTKDMKKALAKKDRKEHKSKKRARRDKEEKRSSGLRMERMRAERLQREEERRRTQALLDQKNGKGKDEASRKETEETDERERPYNSAFLPELARKRQRRDRDSWREEILKS